LGFTEKETMAKNTGASKFRRVDVDQYNEDMYQEDAGDEGVNGVGGEEADESEVTSLLSSGKNIEALQLLLRHPPISTRNQAAKDKAFALVSKVMMSFKGEKNIDEAINTLDKESVDVLMKYIYRLFEAPQEKNYALVLTWHDRAFKVGGHGAILRTMTDRKHV